MNRNRKIKMQKTFQKTYLLTFFISLIGICGNVELDVETPLYCWMLFIISAILTICKMVYHSIKYPNAKYIWH